MKRRNRDSIVKELYYGSGCPYNPKHIIEGETLRVRRGGGCIRCTTTKYSEMTNSEIEETYVKRMKYIDHADKSAEAKRLRKIETSRIYNETHREELAAYYRNKRLKEKDNGTK
jgi:hypothetical protein